MEKRSWIHLFYTPFFNSARSSNHWSRAGEHNTIFSLNQPADLCIQQRNWGE